MQYMFQNDQPQNQGFTLIELLVVAPMVILMLGVIVAMLVNLSGSAMLASAQANLQNDVLVALDMIEQDIKLSTTITSSANNLETENLATSANPLSGSRQLIKASDCTIASNIPLEDTLFYTTTYKVDDSSTPSKVTREIAIPGCSTAAWQKNSTTTLLDLGTSGEYTLTATKDSDNGATVTLSAARTVAGKKVSFTGVLYAKSLNAQ